METKARSGIFHPPCRHHVHVPHDDFEQRVDEPVAGAVAVDGRHRQEGQQELAARPLPRKLHEAQEHDRRGGE